MGCCPTIGPKSSAETKQLKALDSAPLLISSHPEMVKIPSGDWQIGHEGPEAIHTDGEGPKRVVSSSAFLIDRTAVTNDEFAQFIAATGHVTEAEQTGWSFVFYAQINPSALQFIKPIEISIERWWKAVEGATWSTPDGPYSSLENKGAHPVVHVSWSDAIAFSMWARKRLPTEVEWEIAARGGLKGALYPWGNVLTPNNNHRCNIWQGVFPFENTAEDGFLGTAPANSYPPNSFGLFNMVGNTWEWCVDTWCPDQSQLKAMRGGSYLCHRSYCNRYRVSARTANTADATSSHLGFRCAADLIMDTKIDE